MAREVATACENLLTTEPAAVPALTRRAVERITAALQYMDDSGGGIGNDLHMMMALHAAACSAASPEPKRLAAWLVRMRIDGQGWPDFELRDFTAALGDKGRAELSRIVEERAQTVEPDVFGQQPFEIRVLREQLAAISGDVDQFVAVLAEKLGTAAQYLKIVDALRTADRAGDAEKWAYQGLAGLGNPIDMGKLRDAYVDLLLERDAFDEALALRQQVFDKQSTHAQYVALRRTAERIGVWSELREQALIQLRSAVATNPAFADHLIAVLLEEDEQDEAWHLALDCADAVLESRWHQLIELRQPAHPTDVIEPWQRLIEQRLNANSDKYRYSKAIKMLRQLRQAYRAAANEHGFETYMTDLQQRHKRKSSFLSKIDRAELFRGPADTEWEADRDRIDQAVRDPWNVA